VIKIAKNLESEEVSMFLNEIVGMNANESFIVKRMLNLNTPAKDITMKNTLIEKEVKTKKSIYQEIIDDIKSNPNIYTVKDLAKKYNMDYKKMRDILRCHKIYNIVIKNRKRIVATVCDLIEDVKNNPHVYTINDLIKKHGKSYANIYNVLKNHKMRDLIKKGSASMADSKLRAEIASFADKN
jgi:Mor family transcriptional regulator